MPELVNALTFDLYLPFLYHFSDNRVPVNSPLLIGWLNIVVWFTIFYIDRMQIFSDIENQSRYKNQWTEMNRNSFRTFRPKNWSDSISYVDKLFASAAK